MTERSPEQGDQEVRQQERPEHVRRERELIAVGGERSLGRQHAGVVDEHVEARLLGGEARRERPHVVEVAEIAQAGPHVAVPGCRDYGRTRAFPARLAAREQPDARAQPREPLGGREAEPRGRARDEDRLAVHAPEVARAPHAPAQPVADVRIARDDGAVEQRVEQGGDHLTLSGGRPRRWYETNVARGIDPARWWEYSVSASLMVVLIAMLAGVTELVP